MRKVGILGLAAGVVVAGVASVVLCNKINKNYFGLDNYDFDDLDDSDDWYEPFMDLDGDTDVPADDMVSYLESLTDESLAKLGVLDRDSIDFDKLPINVLSKLYLASMSL